MVTVIDEVAPAVEGIHVEVGTSVTTQLIVANDTDETLEVLDDTGQPFLRVGPEGVDANLAAPAWYLTNQPFGGEVPREGVGTDAPARWAHVSTQRSWGWFDHRLHPTAIAGVLEEDRRPTFEVPMRLGDRALVVRGHLEARTTVQRFTAALRAVPDAASGLVVQLLQGRAPGLFVRYEGPGTVVVQGADGEPFVRLGPAGAEVNRRSPTWLYAAQARGEDLAGVDVDPAGEPEWAPVAPTPSYAWLDPRTLIEEAGDEPVTLDWVVPVDVDGRQVEIVGTSTAVVTPLSALAGADQGDDRRGWLLAAVGAGTAATLALVLRLALGRHRTG